MAKGYSARRGFSNGSGQMLKQQQMQQQIMKMQEDMQKAQQEVEEKTFSASVGGGVVSAEVNGKKEVTNITIKPEAVDPEDVEMLQDLIISAVNEALRQAEEAMDGKMNALTSGLGLGGLRLLGNLFLDSVGRLGLGLHRRDKAGRHTVKLANTGKRTLDILGARFGHSCHVTLGGLGTGLALGIGLTRSVGPAVTVPVVDVCHTWPPFLSLPLSAFSHP